MSDHRERACFKCGSLLHHEDDCPVCPRCGSRTHTRWDDCFELEALRGEGERLLLGALLGAQETAPASIPAPSQSVSIGARSYTAPAIVKTEDEYVPSPDPNSVNYLPIWMRETEIPTGPEGPHDWVRKFDTPSNLDIHFFRDRTGEWKARCSWTTLGGVAVAFTISTEEGLVWDAVKEVGDRLWSTACDAKSITHEFFPVRYR
jgi:hypothetical protein